MKQIVIQKNKKKSNFTTPITGYKGTKSEMDAYSINRERDLKRNQ